MHIYTSYTLFVHVCCAYAWWYVIFSWWVSGCPASGIAYMPHIKNGQNEKLTESHVIPGRVMVEESIFSSSFSFIFNHLLVETHFVRFSNLSCDQSAPAILPL